MKEPTCNIPYWKKKDLYIYDEHTKTYKKVATFNTDESTEEIMKDLYRFVKSGRFAERKEE